jgi:hypothetical protein
MPQFLVALPIDPMPQRSTYTGSIPLHVTLMHWFELPVSMSERDLHNELMELASKQKNDYIELQSERFDGKFGPQAKTPVHLIVRNEKLHLLHTMLLIMLARAHAHLLVLDWVGAGYRAHAADVGERIFAPGAIHHADRMVLVEKRDSSKIIKTIYPFG